MLNQQKWTNPFSPTHPKLNQITSVTALHHLLLNYGCNGCNLSSHPKAIQPVLFRGNPASKKMIVGEALGKEEDRRREPFCGPAGELLDRILKTAGWIPNHDWYFTNIVICRPVAPEGSGRQNRKPEQWQIQACFPYLQRQIQIIQPKIICLVGKTALAPFFPERMKESINSLAGTSLMHPDYPDTFFFIFHHPAKLLHLRQYPEKQKALAWEMKRHAELLKEVSDEITV